MLSFECDYNYGAHPAILERLAKENETAYPGYGEDVICDSAKEKIKKACNCPDATVYFTVGGTQTNQIVIDTLLDNYQGVVAATTGHVEVHEAGAIEYTGHKVLTVPSYDGKMKAEDLKNLLATFYADSSYDHMVFPGMVYISFPTEYGTVYTKEEMAELHSICKEYEIPLFVDGARLGYGLAAVEEMGGLTLETLAQNCDVFYIGGTKVGALFGEAIVYTGAFRPKHMITQIKQHGALLAKGWLLGIQYDTLFTNDLYLEISRHAMKQAKKLVAALTEKGYEFFLNSPTNQIFVVLSDEKLHALEKEVRFSVWEKTDATHTVVRFATSWATTDEALAELIALL